MVELARRTHRPAHRVPDRHGAASVAAQRLAPDLAGIWGQEVQLADGSTVVRDEDYLRRSILDPQAHLVAGYAPIMPTFQGQVSEEGVMNLIAYIRSLGESAP